MSTSLVKDPGAKVTSANLGIDVRGGRAYVPPVIVEILATMGAQTVSAAISALEDFPTPFWRASQLPRDAFLQARDGAVGMLRQVPGASVGHRLQGVGFGAARPRGS